MPIAAEENRILALFDRVETVECVALTLPEDDERRTTLLKVAMSALADEDSIRPAIAARVLELSDKTVRAWARHGLIAIVQNNPRMLLDIQSVHRISHILGELRAHGKDRDLLNQVWRLLSDAALVERDDFRESIEQMRRGEGRVLRAAPSDQTSAAPLQ